DPDWQAHLDALLRAVRVFRARGVVVDVADHIDDFTADGDFFARRLLRLTFVCFTLVGECRKRCKSSRGGE
ncbi:MAG TPA: hypothetical protein VIT23_07660, partial [Terrimicrobiaceae bacterium]